MPVRVSPIVSCCYTLPETSEVHIDPGFFETFPDQGLFWIFQVVKFRDLFFCQSIIKLLWILMSSTALELDSPNPPWLNSLIFSKFNIESGIWLFLDQGRFSWLNRIRQVFLEIKTLVNSLLRIIYLSFLDCSSFKFTILHEGLVGLIIWWWSCSKIVKSHIISLGTSVIAAFIQRNAKILISNITNDPLKFSLGHFLSSLGGLNQTMVRRMVSTGNNFLGKSK